MTRPSLLSTHVTVQSSLARTCCLKANLYLDLREPLDRFTSIVRVFFLQVTFKICANSHTDMARIHAHTRGKSHSVRPASKNIPSWPVYGQNEISSLIVQLSKEGLAPSEIGIQLRDEYTIPLTKPILGKSITEVLDENNIKREMPEDLNQLVQKAVGLQKHLRLHNSDHRNIRSLELIEAKIHRLSKYYKRIGKLHKSWKYGAVIAQLE